MASVLILEEGVSVDTSPSAKEAPAPQPDSVCGRAALAFQQSTPVAPEEDNG